MTDRETPARARHRGTNADATLCSRCAQGLQDGDDAEPAPTHRDYLQAALELGGFEGGVLPTFGPGDFDD